MKKQEALKYIKNEMGYIPYSTIFRIYSDDDEIPQELIEASCKKPENINDFIICSAEFAEELTNILTKKI